MKHGSLFSGIGGFDLAAEWMGWENVFHCEWNEFGQKILKHYWPNAKSYSDIKKSDFNEWKGQIDILTGGFPCQPFSAAGKRKGTEDERHLWPEMLRAIQEIQPRWIVGENVYGILNWSGGLVFEQVCADLEAEGYEVQPVILPAAGVNAPHKRDRVWFVAHSKHCGDRKGSRKIQGNSKREGVEQQYEVHKSKQSDKIRGFPTGAIVNTVNGRHKAERKKKRKKDGISKEHRTAMGSRIIDGADLRSISTDSKCKGLEGVAKTRNTEDRKRKSNKAQFFRPLDKCSCWQKFPTQPPICGRDDGISRELDGITFPKWRNESIKGYGNAIVPQVAFEIFKAINEIQP